ncbi:MAG TPA: helix-turn-helix transcriptional regulator, partial [Kofleriaceae bacterium]|nr:helix-turn-helix transcriptional regulator [Kofleriaceae bacterium]
MVDPRLSLALWLRTGRARRGLTLEDVARVTKIQTRMLERLEGGTPDGLPADVFVRGFVRSYARCVGLDEDEALRRYGACGVASAPAVTARAVVEAMADLAPATARAMPASRPPLASGSLPDLLTAATSLEIPATEMATATEAAAPAPAEAAPAPAHAEAAPAGSAPAGSAPAGSAPAGSAPAGSAPADVVAAAP